MTLSNASQLYRYPLQQMAAEAIFERVQISDLNSVILALTTGNGRELDQEGITKLSEAQALALVSEFEIKEQLSDDGSDGEASYIHGSATLANSGLSATLIYDKALGRYTLAVRSTELREYRDGGDAPRDGASGADGDIVANGFAWAQIDALGKYYQYLKGSGVLPNGAILDVTGYSLGGHVATAWAEMHGDQPIVSNVVVFNGAGYGTFNSSNGSSAATLRQMLERYREVLSDPQSGRLSSYWDGRAEVSEEDKLLEQQALSSGSSPLPAENIYLDPRHHYAARVVQREFGVVGGLADGVLNEASFGLLGSVGPNALSGYASATGVVGREYPRLPSGGTLVAESGVYAPVRDVFIEEQPFVQGDILPLDLQKIGPSHSIL